MIDAAPGHVGDVQQAVDAAQVNEGAVIGDVFDHAFHDLAAFQDFHGLGLFFLHGFFEDGFAGQHDIAALLVDLDDAHLKLFAAQAVEVAHGAHIDLRSGQKGADADVDGQAALDALDDAALDHGPFAVGALDLIPDLHPLGFFAGQDDIAVGILGLFQENIDGIAGFDGDLAAIVHKLLNRDDPLGFESDIDNDSAAGDGDDSSLDDFSFGKTLGSSFVGCQELLKAVFILFGFGSGYRRILLVCRRFLQGRILSLRDAFH